MDVRGKLTSPFPCVFLVGPYHRAFAIALGCSAVLAVGLLRAYLVAPAPLTSAEILLATRRAVDEAVETAIERGGLRDAEAFVTRFISVQLERMGFGGVEVRLRRPNDLNPWAPFHFFVEIGDLSVRFDIDGTRDPLLAIRLGLDVRIRADPNHPYASHSEPGILAVCLAHRYYHAAPDGPDLFARLENKTRDPYHFGFETFVTDGDRLAVDHIYLETGAWGLTVEQAVRYGR